MKQPKTVPTKKSFEDYPDEDYGFASDATYAGGWPDADANDSPVALDVFPPDEEPRIDRSTGPKAVPAKEKAPVASVKRGRGK